MIYSTGIDIVDLKRIADVYDRYGMKFLKKILSEDEIILITAKKSGLIASLSGKFAAKEAVMKALVVFFEDGVSVKDIEVLNHQSGQPFIRLPQRLTDKMGDKNILISISHEKRFAVASAIITDRDPTGGIQKESGKL